MSDILITGFSPFDARPVNASWIAARALARHGHWHGHALHALEIPVCWGAPRRTLDTFLRELVPGLILSMGEGEVGTFRIETLARNTRRERADNDGQLPGGVPISPAGPPQRHSSMSCDPLCRSLAAQGIPIRLSDDAGAYLCEELLYTLEELKVSQPQIAQVLFVHVPPFGTSLHYKEEARTCSEALLEEFGLALLDAVLAQT